MYSRGMFKRQVLRGVALLKLGVTCDPLRVDYSRLKTAVFKNHMIFPPLLSDSSLAPSSKPHINRNRESQFELNCV